MTNHHGFTTLELMIVVAIFSILATISFGLFANQIEHYRLTTAKNELVSAMRKEVQTAVTRNADRTMTFIDNVAPNNDRYTLGDGTQITLPNGIQFGVSGAGAPPNGTADVGGAGIGGAPYTFSGNTVTFQSNRIPDEAGEVYLTNAKGENMAVSVNIVGRVRCWRGGGGGWQAC